MKTILSILFLALINFNASAMDICSFSETSEMHDAFEQAGIQATRVTKNYKRLKFNEKQMIHRTVTLQRWLSGFGREEALEEFISGDGEISYFMIGSKEIAIVRYWPGDTQVGAIYEMKINSYKMIAQIDDSFIECK